MSARSSQSGPSAALQAAKARGKVLGDPNGARALLRPGKGNTAAVAEGIAKADRHALDVLPIIEDIRSAGIAGLRGIAAELNARGILTARSGQWYPMTVRNLLARSGRLL